MYALEALLLPAAFLHSWWQVVTVFVVVIIGKWSADKVDALWGKDSHKVVIDEVAGMAITLLYIPHTVFYLLAGLVAFRFFDIAKPLGIKQMEKLPKGLGVMADDILAGLYAFIILRLLLFIHLVMLNKHL